MSEQLPKKLTRRQILTTTSLGAIATTAAGALMSPVAAQQPIALLPKIKLPPWLASTEKESGGPPTALPNKQRVGFAIVGLGRLALEEILPAFAQSQHCQPVALVSGSPDKAAIVAQQYGINPKNIYSYQNYDNIRDNPEVDVIYIVLPNALHAEYTIRGAQAGKHILCEKPMATSPEECQRMIDACNQAHKKLMVAYRIQYEPYNRTVMQLVRRKELGVVQTIQADNGQNQGGDLNQWRLKKALAGGGCLPDVGLYCLNTSRFLTGEEPIEISATMYSTPGDPRFKEVEENINFLMRFPSGILANCSASYGYHEARRYRLFGSEAWAQLDPAFAYRGLRMTMAHKSKINSMAEDVEDLRLDEKNQFALEMDHMAECVLENKQPYTPGEEGLQDHKLMAIIYEAARTGKTIKLPTVFGLDVTRGPQPTSL
ncbi:MAG: Gfo/Idh/MocA family oxidoreductase [Chroococcidiopsidaceae cyanobacterium CP_BM_RX_35]|nr:Gfo/Idh/MocA family oxidoreductase [Chroococcidiopsidaceae cyanobacterium CP_BM_RX_35]